MNLDPQTVREVLQRAQEIDQDALTTVATDREEIVRAAEEAGLSRAAVQQALAERFGAPIENPEVGREVFALSADKKFYVAEVLRVEGDHARVRFLTGQEARLPLSNLRECHFLPGAQVEYLSPDMEMWVTGKVVGFDRDKKKLVATAWGSEEKVKLDRVRISLETKPPWLYRYAPYLMTFIAGGAASWILQVLLNR